MKSYLPPLSVIFVWHPATAAVSKPIVEHCFSLLSRDVDKAFSRSMNLPIFYRTSCKKGVPTKIEATSKKTVVFIFVNQEVVADDSWVGYLKDIPKTESVHIIPIALDKTAFNLNDVFNNSNFIRAYEFDQNLINDYMFLAVTHEIYRCALNESFRSMAVGKDNALKIFLSHAKDGKNGIKLAKALKKFIDNSSMRNFFDATDIAPGYRFDEEIIGHIRESTVIAIHSDSYSSRYWCQREILSAKELNRPIVAIDTIEEFEDRRFPFASNIPGVHVHLDGEPTEKDLLRILSSTLLESVRFFYSKLLLEQFIDAGWVKPDVEIRSRPPEVSDIEKLLFDDCGSIKCKHKSLVYPDPPLYSEELSFLSKLGIQLSTPLTFDFCSLKDKSIGVSISEPSEEELITIGQTSAHLIQLSQDVARHLLSRGATLVYGGDLRENGFTEFIFNEAHALQARLQSQSIFLKNYIAWPIYKNDSDDVSRWKAKYRPIAKMVEVPPPDDIRDLIPSEDSFWTPGNSQNLFVWSRCLTEMRNKMIEKCDVRICAGGRHFGYKGRMPGVLEEIIIAVEMKRPLFLLGGFGGVTTSVCKLIQNITIPEELTQDWQIQNNMGYKELLDFCSSRDGQHSVDYIALVKNLKSENLNNGLSKEDNILLFNTPFMDEALHLIFKGLKSIFIE
ncbi:TIR domain-containing protein [Desulfosporosinus fructosivorans]